MRNLKRYLAVLVAITMMFTLLVPVATAAVVDAEDAAITLYNLDLYKGISEDDFDPDLGSTLNRETAVTMLLRMAGVEQDALDMTTAEATAALSRFADANTIAAWAMKQVAYAVDNDVVKGFQNGDIFTFQPKGLLTVNQWSTLLLKQLGYDVPEFSKASMQFATTSNATPEEIAAFGTVSAVMNKGQLVQMSHKALSTEMNGRGMTLIEELIRTGNVDEEIAIEEGFDVGQPEPTATPTVAPVLDPVVKSVTATNGTLTVVMDKAVEPAPVVADFSVTKKVTGAEDESVVATVYSYDAETMTVVLNFDAVAATIADQSVTLTVAYKGGTAVAANAFTVEAVGIPVTVTSLNSAGVESPLNGSTDVMADKARGFKVVFGKKVDEDTINRDNIKLYKGTALVAIANPSLASDGVTVQIYPTANLSDLTDYKLVLFGAIKADGAETTLETNNEFTFKTNEVAFSIDGGDSGIDTGDNSSIDVDFTKTEVPNVATIGASDAIFVAFNKSLDRSSVGSSTVKIKNITDNVFVPVAVSAATTATADDTIKVEPTDDLDVSKKYEVQVGNVITLLGITVYPETYAFTVGVTTPDVDLMTAAGTDLLTANLRVWPNKVGGLLDGTSRAQLPISLIGVFGGTPNLDESTINGDNVYLQKWDTTTDEAISTVPGTVVYDSSIRRVTFTPDADLDGGSTYKFTVSDDVKDEFGGAITEVAESFKTFDVTAPTVTAVKVGVSTETPVEMAEGTAVVDETKTNKFVFVFSEAIGFGEKDQTDASHDKNPGVVAANTDTFSAADVSVLVLDADTGDGLSSVTGITATRNASDEDELTVTIPSSLLTRGKTYTIKIAGKNGLPSGSSSTCDVLTDMTDDNIGATYTNRNRMVNTYSYNFSTRTEDTTSPAVSGLKSGSSYSDSSDLASGQVNVSETKNIYVLFNEKIDHEAVVDATELKINTQTGQTDVDGNVVFEVYNFIIF
jgi:hypothetical protein